MKARAECRTRTRPWQYQNHHIVPQCLGGDNTNSNLVLLTPREHYICHLLLTRMVTGHDRSKMIFAFFRFRPKGYDIWSSYGYNRHVLFLSDNLKGESNPFFGKKHTKQTRDLISANHGMRGKNCYDVWVENFGTNEANLRWEKMLQKRSRSLTGPLNPMFGVPKTAAQKSHQAMKMMGHNNPNFGKDWCWVSRGGVSKRVERSFLPGFLNEGWRLGRKS